MKMNGLSLISRGVEKVYIYGDWFRRTVYCHPKEWKFFVRINGEIIEVYHKSCWFSTEKGEY